jgi:hypothetical protein
MRRAALWSCLALAACAAPALPPPDAATLHGLSIGSRVTRGASWSYGEQDGGAGSLGTVLEFRPWRGSGNASTVVAARVRWDATGAVNAYRWAFGATGERDLELVSWRPLTTAESAVPTSHDAAAALLEAGEADGPALAAVLHRVWHAWGGPRWRAARGWAAAFGGAGAGGGVSTNPCGGGRRGARDAAAHLPAQTWEEIGRAHV